MQPVVEPLGDGEELRVAIDDDPARVDAERRGVGDEQAQHLGDTPTVRGGVDVPDRGGARRSHGGRAALASSAARRRSPMKRARERIERGSTSTSRGWATGPFCRTAARSGDGREDAGPPTVSPCPRPPGGPCRGRPRSPSRSRLGASRPRSRGTGPRRPQAAQLGPGVVDDRMAVTADSGTRMSLWNPSAFSSACRRRTSSSPSGRSSATAADSRDGG